MYKTVQFGQKGMACTPSAKITVQAIDANHVVIRLQN